MARTFPLVSPSGAANRATHVYDRLRAHFQRTESVIHQDPALFQSMSPE
jgi:hypothetical protein